MTQQALTILGSTGSIGESTLDVVARHPDRFRIHALTAHRQTKRLAAQCMRFRPRYAVVGSEAAAVQLRGLLQAASVNTEVLHGVAALCDVASDSGTDAVMAAIVGAAGLPPAMAAARSGKTIYLANKETLVVGGAWFMRAVQAHGARLLPVDSEHNAIFQSLPENYRGDLDAAGVASLILTASGGPFLHTDLAAFPRITPEQAVKPPNWQMGRKISIDSATMMNKGLELIEARWLFNALPQRMEVLIHPQSVVHSMVRYRDGSVIAQMGTPDMRIPIAYCLGLPERMASGAEPLDFTQLSGLSFFHPDFQRFPCLKLAYDVLLSEDAAAGCVLNAANEVAVTAFLDKQIAFTDIAAVVAQALDTYSGQSAAGIDDVLNLDARVRASTRAQISGKGTGKL